MGKSIVFLSNNKRKALLYQFCVAYKSILSRYPLVATAGTSRVLRNAGLEVYSLLSGSVGGYHQVVSKLFSEEVKLLIFLRSVSQFESPDSVESSVFRACDLNNVPYATNILTAEILLRAMNAGEF